MPTVSSLPLVHVSPTHLLAVDPNASKGTSTFDEGFVVLTAPAVQEQPLFRQDEMFLTFVGAQSLSDLRDLADMFLAKRVSPQQRSCLTSLSVVGRPCIRWSCQSTFLKDRCTAMTRALVAFEKAVATANSVAEAGDQRDLALAAEAIIANLSSKVEQLTLQFEDEQSVRQGNRPYWPNAAS